MAQKKKMVDNVKQYFSFAKKPQNKRGPNPTMATFHAKTMGKAGKNSTMASFHTLNGKSPKTLGKTNWSPGAKDGKIPRNIGMQSLKDFEGGN